jgi:hypothetical protein
MATNKASRAHKTRTWIRIFPEVQRGDDGIGAGRRSRCEALAEVISAKVEVGLSAQRIYQDLVEQNGFSDSYQSVQRFVRKLKGTQPQRVWRMEAQPGEEVQVDFGLGAAIGITWRPRTVPTRQRALERYN